MAKTVEVTLSIKAVVDDEYSVVDHANDIILSAKNTFAMAEVRVIGIRFSDAKARTGPA